MKVSTDDKGAHLWAVVTATVRPLRGHGRNRQAIASPPPPASATAAPPMEPPKAALPTPRKTAKPALVQPQGSAPQSIEPGRRRRIDRARDRPGAMLDLHGLTQDQARATLTAFLMRGFVENRRTLLVITGKGALGDGVLRRRVPEWLSEPPLRQLVAGLSVAHRRHGGEGALYVALKRSLGH